MKHMGPISKYRQRRISSHLLSIEGVFCNRIRYILYKKQLCRGKSFLRPKGYDFFTKSISLTIIICHVN